MIELTVSEVRQWAFCPRVIWHRRMMPQRVRETAKMQAGQEAQAVLERFEKRRTGRRYGLARATRRFGVAVSSERLGVRGVCDLVLDVRDAQGRVIPVPVEVKRTEGGASHHHRIQLAGYAVLLEETAGLPTGEVGRGFVVLLPSEDVVGVGLGVGLRGEFEEVLGAIREMLEREKFPGPTRHRGFCPQCEYVHHCGDVL